MAGPIVDLMDPVQANYQENTPEGRMIGGLVALTALALASGAAYFLAPFAIEASAAVIVSGTTINGVTKIQYTAPGATSPTNYYGVTVQQATFVENALADAAANGATLPIEVSTILNQSMLAKIGSGEVTIATKLFDAAVFAALYGFNITQTDAPTHGNIGNYFSSGPGGDQSIPGFPGFPGVSYRPIYGDGVHNNGPGGHGQWTCVIIGDEHEENCHWQN